MKTLICVVLVFVPLISFGLSWTQHVVDGSATGVTDVCSADFDGDGDIDLIGSPRENLALVLWNNIDGQESEWNAETIATELSVNCIDVGDINADSHPDVIVALFAGGQIRLWLNTGSTPDTWEQRTVVTDIVQVNGVRALDIDGDTDLDIVGAVYGDGDVAWWENEGDPWSEWPRHDIDLSFPTAASVDGADVDGDGDLDIVALSELTGNVMCWRNMDGSGLIWEVTSLSTTFMGGKELQVGDVDGDNDIDIVAAAQDLHQVVWWENFSGNGTSWNEHIIDPDFIGAKTVALNDMDMDGDLDIIAGAYVENKINYYENRGGQGQIWLKSTIHDQFDYTMAVYIDDVDGDQDNDVVGGSYVEDDVIWWESDGIYNTSLIRVTLTPASGLSLYPGGYFEYDVELVSNLLNPQLVDVWTEALLPSGGSYGPIWRVFDLPLLPGSGFTAEGLYQAVPAFAAPGTYQFVMNAGNFCGFVAGTDSLTIEMLDPPLAATGTYQTWQSNFLGEPTPLVIDGLPTSLRLNGPELQSVQPNPFNPTTTISVAIPRVADLTVAVYNVMGQQVAELVRGQIQAGTHSFVLDGSNLSSGIYFVHASVPGELNAVQKVTLLK